MKRVRSLVTSVMALALLVVPAVAFGASNSDVTQTINAGTLSTDVLDGSRNPVASPSVSMTAANFSFDCQTVTGTLGTASQRLYVIDPSTTANGWALSLGATGGGTATWHNAGSTRQYAFNDATGTGCTNGQLTVNPAVATVTADCTSSTCTTATVTKGSSTAMSGSGGVTLMTGAAATNLWRGYLTGVSLSQKIPGETPADSYSLNMTLTVAAN